MSSIVPKSGFKVPQYFPEGILSFSLDKSHKSVDKKYTECKFLNF